MTAKRFIIQDERVIKDNQKYVTENGYAFSYKSDAEEVCNLLNELFNENEQLKGEVMYWRILTQSLAKKNNVKVMWND